MKELEFSITKSPEIKDIEFLWSKLREHGLEKLANSDLEDKYSFGILARRDDEIFAGLLGVVYYKGMHIQLLWVSDSLRKTGVGTTLLQKAEALALETDCTLIYLDTFSFQAPKFYEKLGFEVFGKIENFPETYTRFFLLKRLN